MNSFFKKCNNKRFIINSERIAKQTGTSPRRKINVDINIKCKTMENIYKM